MKIFVRFQVALLSFAAFGCQDNSTTEDFPKASLGPLGGSITVQDVTRHAFSREAPGLTIDESRAFFRGKALFRDDWVIAPASAASRDGLGPVFNARNCETCHVRDGRGRPPEQDQGRFETMLVRISMPNATPESGPVAVPNYGTQIQNLSIPGVKSEAQPRVSYEIIKRQYPDGQGYELTRPIYSFEKLAFGSFPDGMQTSPRVAPSMIGLGLLEAISEEDILAKADPDDLDGDGISGRANNVWDQVAGRKSLGRFGWKANQPHLKQQTAGAFLGDIGITSSLFPDNNCAENQENCHLAITGGLPELLDVILDDVAMYSQTLAVPAQRHQDDPAVVRGFQVFQEVQCAACHTVSHQASDTAAAETLKGETFHPFTDLLLHDMGPELADNREDFLANGQEWRTPPLWGVGLQGTVNGHTRFMHDGRARNLEEAILWHGGEAETSRQQFKELPSQRRSDLLRFLESL